MIKKILVPYATYGNGHKIVANYIKTSFLNKNDNLIIKTIDLLDYTTPFMKRFSQTLFEKTMFAKRPVIWDLVYRFYNHNIQAKGLKYIAYQLFDKDSLRKEIIDFNPDVIISTHYFASMIVAKYKKKNLINSKLYTIITDYELHEAWINTINDEEAVIVSNKDIRNEILKKGVSKEKVKVFGMPLSDSFINTNIYKEKLKLDKEKITILFFGGGNNSKVSIPFFKKLINEKYNFNIIFIAGNNKKIKKKVTKIVKEFEIKNVKIIGFTKRVNDYMNASDLVITKPGGMTISECIFMQKPMLLINRSAGQEKGNYKYLLKKKYALKASNIYKFNRYLKKINKDPSILEKMKNNMKNENKKKATDELYRLIIK